MSLNKTQLEQVNQSNFPNNNQQLITPEKLREFNTDMIEAMVINDATASFAKTDVSNTFTANQTINGNLTVTGTISASVIHTQIETASVIYSSGSNQFGDELTDVQTLSGSVRIQGNLLVNGLPIFTGSVNTDGLVTTSSFNAYTASINAEISALEANTASVNASITNINSFTQSANISISALNAFTQSQAALNGTFATTGSNTFTGNQIIDRASKLYTNGIYWTDVTAGYNNLEIINQGGGNLDFASLNGGKVRFVSSSVNFLNSAISSSNDISTSANIYAANLTGSTINTGSFATTGSNTFRGTQTISGSILPLVDGQGDLGTDSQKWNSVVVNGQIKGSSVNASGRSFLGTVRLADETFPLSFLAEREIVGDGSGANTHMYYGTGSATDALREFVYAQSGSNADFTAVSASFNTRINNITGSGTINTGSFATTGSNTFTGQQTIQNNLVIEEAGNPLIYTQFIEDPLTNKLQISQAGASGVLFNTNVQVNELTASLTEGYVWAGGVGNITKLVATSSFGGSTNTGSLLVTASAAGATITFTKGDGSTFDVSVATGSVASASFAETASLAINAKDIIVNVKNTTGVQINKGTIVRIIGATGDNPLIGTASWTDDGQSANTLGFVTANIPNDSFGTVMTQGTLLGVNTDPTLGYTAGQMVYLSGSGQYTNVKPPAPYHEVRLGQVLRAQQNNGSIYVLIQNGYELTELHDVDINTGSLANNDLLAWDSASAQWTNKTITQVGAASTGSNSFNGSQTITGSLIVDYSGGNPELVIDSITNEVTLRKSAGVNPLQIIGSPGGGVTIDSVETYIGDSANILYPNTSGNQNQLKTTKINGSFTASLAQGYVWVGDSTNTSVLVATSSFGGTIPDGRFATLGTNTFTGSQTITGTNGLTLAAEGGGSTSFAMSGSQTNITLTAPNSFFNVGGLFNFNNNYANGGSGSLQFSAVSSSVQFYSTNGTIFGQAFVAGGPAGQGFVNMNTTSGSLFLTPSGFSSTLASISHVSSSSNSNNVNLIFKNSNTAATTILSGSANIFSNPAAPTAGFVRYMTGGNIAVGGSGAAVPQISASMAWSPAIANNVFANSSTPLTFRGPVSSSASTINNNVFAGGTITLGTAAATDFGRATAGTVINGNILNSSINAFAYKTPLTTAINITNNNMGGAANLNADSSSFALAGNTIQVASLTVNNSYSSSVSAPNNLLQIGPGNGMFGQNILIYASGSNTSATPRGIYANLIAGIFVTASVNLNGDNSALSSTTIAGHGLSVTGSATHFVGIPTRNSTHGSAFFGRFNAEDGNKAKTAETIFAVGTGTTSAAKTGFLIDSGSNTFVEGSLNVSGSSRFNGAVNVTGSLVANKLSCYDFDSLYYGSQMGGTTANGTFFGYGSTSYSWIMGAYAGGFDNELQFYTDSSGVYFNDFNGAGYTTFLKLSPNPGTNPAPIMTRGLIVTGSMNVSGSITAVTFGAQGNVITNATPVSSSLQPTLNIVTLTSAEYALITPNSQTLYVIV